MNNPDYDYLWKDVITSLFEEFLLFFSPDLYERVDFSVQHEFLEQELLTIIPDSNSNKRTSDKLVKLHLKDGNEQWVYIHIEVQGDYRKDFPKRMFQSFYRIMDLYDQPVYAIALFTDERASYNKNQYYYEFLETKVTYHYNTFRIASQTETTLLQSQNPFALAILAGLYAIKSKKNKDMKYHFKRHLMRILFQDKMKEDSIKRENISKLFLFIDKIIIMPYEQEIALIQEIELLVEKEGSVVGLSIEDTVLGQYLLNKAREKAKIEERQEVAEKLIKLNVSVETIIEATGLSKEEVEKLKD
ncbi:putative transposase/invertase (TIGR01784 family) [Bacillus mesophilus]|uniref:Transposase (putative) YhgA-like domain-containing protein n=1 Tax=Bacillus mesophilus TaxID=1808955 RepID=A0A6M0QDH8_9BACI|nr:hypothetical protein [Bacillus mesophilus]MBM7662792.1 putative transposase/invertase (TIGR01784 family) [Bacillus mesophilus]NEY74257.1 hypothetical protein [Bacillus mesophilus]